MTGKETKNVTASVLAKLRNNSKSSGAPFQQVLQLYAMERFQYRISKSQHAQSVILKGALLLKTIGIPSARPTVDIDMLRKGIRAAPSLRDSHCVRGHVSEPSQVRARFQSRLLVDSVRQLECWSTAPSANKGAY
jgi:hypothetical protein